MPCAKFGNTIIVAKMGSFLSNMQVGNHSETFLNKWVSHPHGTMLEILYYSPCMSNINKETIRITLTGKKEM